MLLAVRHHEIPVADRPAEGPATEGMDAAELRDHVRRLQDARLLTRSGSYDIDQQATTETARELWPVWTAALQFVHAIEPEHPQKPVAAAIEDALYVADHPSALKALHAVQGASAPMMVMVRGLAGLMDRLERRKADSGQPTNRAAIEGLDRLAQLHTALGDWHRIHYAAARSAAATTRTIAPTPDRPVEAVPPPPPAPRAAPAPARGPKTPGR
ncbi:hypothetical protein ACFVUH_08300 [Kitasatospora sp. NPDC058032]|uniref:hypothetical protein n=1 Tax=Kitasatospora sp. NPDC058032 TaxID=3346307 RepID=UPI0036D940E7